jgi:diketogulonate reductase-like aldo/keto reductase
MKASVSSREPTRRAIIRAALSMAGATGLGAIVPPAWGGDLATKPIPSTGERVPVVGLGSWITFNVGNDPGLLDECAAVIAAFFAAGGRMIDSSPMYASSQPTIGYGLRKIGHPDQLFSAEKVWTSNPSNGPSQIEQSRSYWGLPRFDLMQVHNLLSWEKHLATLQSMKAAGKLRYVGITTSEGRRHRELERIMASRAIDFVQVTYNILDREIEARILPLANERGIAVIANRPYRQKALIRQLADKPLPPWAGEVGASSWAQFVLRFAISHPAVTCAIPATTRVDHVQENMSAARGPLPDQHQRRRMADYVRQL